MWIIVAVVVVVIAGGAWWWSGMSQSQNPSQGLGQTNTPVPAPVAETNPTSTTNPTTAAAPLPSGNSDQAISQELNMADAQLNGFTSDSANINQGLNDQPVQQSQL